VTGEELVLRLLEEVFTDGKLDSVDQLVHPDFFDHDAAPSRSSGHAGLKATISRLHAAFAGFRLEAQDIITENEKVAVRTKASGRHRGELNGIPPTGREWSSQEIHIFRLVDGKVIEHWANRDDLGAMRQLGLLQEVSLG